MNYEETQPDRVVNVLGTPYAIYIDVPAADDEMLEACDGYCDKSTKRIVIAEKPKENELGDWERYRRYVLRHEVVHAFLFESGHGGNTTWDIPGEEHPEHMVEWIAMQFPKILKVYQEIGAI